MENNSFVYYVFVLIAIVVGFLVVKKVASCLVKSIVLVLLVAALFFLYFTYFK